MAVMYSYEQRDEVASDPFHYDVNAELAKHSWRPGMDALEAEALLAGKSPYTYLLRPSIINRKFVISFVRPNGTIEHDTFSLIDAKRGIWRNAYWHHVGTLEKVVRDMMDCDFSEGTPLR